VRPGQRALGLLATLIAASAAAACDGLIGLTDPTVDAGAHGAAVGFDATTDAGDSPDDAPDEAQPPEAEAASVVDSGEIFDVVVDAGQDREGGPGPGGNGDSGGCMPKTCAELGYNCGANGDGCGNVIECGTCTPPEFCSGGGFSVCGGGSQPSDTGTMGCVPTTCAQLGYDCGFAGDGCGGTLQCGTCIAPAFCGGGGFQQCGGGGDP
jgi:hypothetical protein